MGIRPGPTTLRLTVLIALIMVNCARSPVPHPSPVPGQSTVTGLDVLNNTHFSILEHQSVGLVINQTSVDRHGVPILDLLSEIRSSIHVQQIFTPEHGFWGDVAAGETVDNDTIPFYQIPVTSLYGNHQKPTREELAGLDVLVFDLADVGARYYTYVSTLTYVMEAAAENNIPVVVLDRPNPINGITVSGPVLYPAFRSFVGLHPIPVRHGLTIGELALMINHSGWLSNGLRCDLRIIPLQNWDRTQWFDDTRLPWIPPSPNIPDDSTSLIYTGFCLLEGTNISEGRGTDEPFKLFGAPWIDGDRLAQVLNVLALPGVKFSPVTFTPESIPGKSTWPKYLREICSGCRVNITNRELFQPLNTVVTVMKTIQEMYPDEFEILGTNYIDLLYGSDELRKSLAVRENPKLLLKRWERDSSDFLNFRTPYLLY